MESRTSNYEYSFLDSPVSTGSSAAAAAAAGGAELLDAYSRAVTDVVQKVGPAVVNVHMRRKSPARSGG